ncbi:hypothetical protein [Brachybacterium epidermidis]|uniref:hypothetical protein n=1 Tax=Brachybacterium epidermidis TaxID=2781983 RepID=UPI00398E4C45
METEPRFKKYAWEPRSFLVQPTHFGLYEDVRWRDATEGTREQDRLLAAQWQHEMVLLVHDVLAYEGKPVTWLAAQTRMGPDNLWRLMRGVGPMKVEDFAALSRVLKVYFVSPNGSAPRPASRPHAPRGHAPRRGRCE